MAIALATWWLISVGGEAEANDPLETLLQLPATTRRRSWGWRLVGIFRRGYALIIAALLNSKLLPPKAGQPEPWPGLINFPATAKMLC